MSVVRAMIPAAAAGCLMAGTASAFLTGRKRGIPWMLPVPKQDGTWDKSTWMTPLTSRGRGRSGYVYKRTEGLKEFLTKSNVKPAGVSLSECVVKVQKGVKGGEQEAAMYKKVGQHENVVTLHNSYTIPEGNKHYMVLEKCQAEVNGKKVSDLRRYLNAAGLRTLKRETVFDFTRQLVAGVKHMHSKKVIHRDLKPDNIFVKNGGEGPAGITLKIGGLGHATNEGCTIPSGSPHYVCPEMFSTREGCRVKGANSKCDMYSLGVTLYEVAFGELPYFVFDVSGKCPPWSFRKPDNEKEKYGPEFKALIDGLLKEKPEDRWDMEKVFEQLEKLK